MSDEREDGHVEYELCERFDIDDGELDGLEPTLVFAMGAEWIMVRDELDAGREIVRVIHTENCERFEKMCQRRGREAIFAPVEGMEDQWTHMTVEAM